jgi:cytochrome P450
MSTPPSGASDKHTIPGGPQECPVHELASGFSHHDEGLDDAFRKYAQFRTECPVGRSDMYGGFWFVTRYRDICEIEQNPQCYGVAPTMLLPQFSDTPMIPVDIDPPAHTNYRGLLLPAFSSSQVARIEPRIREAARGLLDKIGRDVFDASKDFARVLPMIVLSQMAGFPADGYTRYQEWIDRIVYGRTQDPGAAQRASEEVYQFLRGLLRARARKKGPSDLVGILLRAEIDGHPLSEYELVNYLFTLMMAGLETTAWAIRSSLWYLAQHPVDRRRIIDNPAMAPVAAEELLRCLSPVQGMARTVIQDGAELGGVRFKKGDRVLLLFAAGNRDEAKFENSELVDISRKPNPHFSFGVGIHRCLGSHLARRELKVALQEFLGRFPDFSLADPGDTPWYGVGPLLLATSQTRPR